MSDDRHFDVAFGREFADPTYKAERMKHWAWAYTPLAGGLVLRSRYSDDFSKLHLFTYPGFV
jgi:hypothetical protein